ncbi:hypothetical protein FEM48_Zijuj09G0091600 [Ziziphus jujuba var. spinosa]|uniref:Disease resistance R13L4/SHOC-2-like LRR domain-containing protein n=1 Tax=Ziziphus jujuba var. spinosa TaxID=714518 RepID=A0A978US44_ZIZJJ|nr:hypothetical protein FEM48_Zijuj09G0091600 [Ziziphus jujuba var. spinosa]
MLYEAKHLRTLLFSEGNVKHVHRGSFSSFKYLRAVNLSGCGVVVMEDELMGELLFLRYLHVSDTHIRSLPRSIECLRCLQTLNLSNCHDHQVLPNLANMLSLRHLNNTGCESLTTMLPLHEPFNQLQQLPAEITREYQELVNTALPKSQNQLQTLSLFVVAGLPDLLLLQWLNVNGSLKITRLGTVDILQIIYLTNCVTVNDTSIRLADSSYSILKEMKYIESLGLFWGIDDPEDQENVFARFQERKPNPSYRPASISPIRQSYIFLFL